MKMSRVAFKKLQEWSREHPDQIPIKNFIEQRKDDTRKQNTRCTVENECTGNE